MGSGLSLLMDKSGKFYGTYSIIMLVAGLIVLLAGIDYFVPYFDILSGISLDTLIWILAIAGILALVSAFKSNFFGLGSVGLLLGIVIFLFGAYVFLMGWLPSELVISVNDMLIKISLIVAGAYLIIQSFSANVGY